MLVAATGSRAYLLQRLVLTPLRCFYGKDYASSSDDESDKTKKKSKQKDKVVSEAKSEESAAERLNRLLASMQTDDSYSLGKQLDLAQPGKALKKRKEAGKQDAMSKNVAEAAKHVASMLDEDNKKQTESELLSKLLGHNAIEEPKDIASNAKQSSQVADPAELSLSELIAGMKIDRSAKPQTATRADYVRRTKAEIEQKFAGNADTSIRSTRFGAERKHATEMYTGTVNLFGGEALGIFKKAEKLPEPTELLSTWADMQQRTLKLAVTHPPANFFEKMVMWTDQGKVWRFPIDNEQNWPEEAHVDFMEHIFLEQHLESWCPTSGPIRHFMELVCVGLSKNHHLSAREKKEHILWYQNYFENKKDLLKDLISLKEKPKNITAGQTES